jgi:hypothetical protein
MIPFVQPVAMLGWTTHTDNSAGIHPAPVRPDTTTASTGQHFREFVAYYCPVDAVT